MDRAIATRLLSLSRCLSMAASHLIAQDDGEAASEWMGDYVNVNTYLTHAAYITLAQVATDDMLNAQLPDQLSRSSALIVKMRDRLSLLSDAIPALMVAEALVETLGRQDDPCQTTIGLFDKDTMRDSGIREQAFRRGYHHGVCRAMTMVEQGEAHRLAELCGLIHDWRFKRIDSTLPPDLPTESSVDG